MFGSLLTTRYHNITSPVFYLDTYGSIDFICQTIFISILGLIGLAHFIAEKSTKEIGVRKVLGGSRAGIVGLLLWKFIKPVIFSNILAIPVACYKDYSGSNEP